MDPVDRNIEDLAESFLADVEVKDRKYHLKTFKKVFVGKEAVDALISSGSAKTRDDAVCIGRALESEFRLFEHVTREHEFKDGNFFYRFVDKNKRGSIGQNEATGKDFGWADFLDPTALGHSNGNAQPNFPVADFDIISEKDAHVAAQVWPFDKYNSTLLDNVHPPNWVDPNPHRKSIQSTGEIKESSYYDLVVIGAGSGGLVTSAGAAGVGARVALIEENLMGGDCLNVGCVPSKSLIHAANLVHKLRGDAEHLADSGITIEGGPSTVNVDFSKVMERVRRIRSQISHHDSASRFTKELGVEVYFGRGTFSSERTVTVNGRTISFKKAVIATGGYPSLIPMLGLKELHSLSTAVPVNNGQPRPAVMTNETVFNLTSQPEHMVVIGAGVVGMELAQAFQRLGTTVTVLGRSGKVLPREDEDLSRLVKDQMESDGVVFRLSVSQYTSIQLTDSVLDNGLPEMMLKISETIDGSVIDNEIICDAILVAAGRKPNVTGMALEKAGIKYNQQVGLIVNDRLQTSNSRVYGVGDCCSEFKFTHAADFMARIAIRNALFFGRDKMSSLLIPYATYTTPEIASVGLYENDLNEKGIAFKTFEKHFRDNDRALCDGATTGMVRFRVDARSDKILGASVVGAGASNMISEITLAMQSDTGLGKLAAVIHPYPTTAEAVRQAGDLYNKGRLTTAVSVLLRGIIKAQR